MAGVQSEIFQGRGGFGELGHIGKHFVKNFAIFSPRYS